MQREELDESLRLLVATSANEGRLAYRSLKRAQEEFQVSRRKYRLAFQKRQAGALTVNRLLEVEAELTAAEQLYQAARVGYYLAINEYLYAIGSEDIYGGFLK
jgi:outer membrane protein TolC